MSLSVNKIAFSGSVNNVSNVNSTNKTANNNTNLLQQQNFDSVNFKGKELTDEEKKELVLKARTKAAGYSFWFGPLSVLYYGLRSDKTVAQKYDLDQQADKKLIKKIKNEQLLWTLPACIPGMSIVTGGAAYLYNKNCDADKIEL